MNEFSAESIFNIGRILTSVRLDTEKKNKDSQVSPHETQELLGVLSTIEKRSSALALRHSLKAVQELMEAIGNHERTHGDFARDVWDIERSIRREMADQLFMFVPPDRADFYTKAKTLFNPQIRKAFPSAEYDMEEAAKCFALARYTACVFHLMRVTEAGLKALVQDLDLTWEHNWGANLKNVRTELNQRSVPGKGKPKDAFYSQAAKQLGWIKDDRNSTMHLTNVYGQELAEELFNSTKALMRILSERLSEK